jgi:hypothetical protein
LPACIPSASCAAGGGRSTGQLHVVAILHVTGLLRSVGLAAGKEPRGCERRMTSFVGKILKAWNYQECLCRPPSSAAAQLPPSGMHEPCPTRSQAVTGYAVSGARRLCMRLLPDSLCSAESLPTPGRYNETSHIHPGCGGCAAIGQRVTRTCSAALKKQVFPRLRSPGGTRNWGSHETSQHSAPGSIQLVLFTRTAHA